MRDQLANLIARLRSSSRQEQLYVLLGAVVFLVVLRFAIGWMMDYRAGVKDDIQLSAQRLATARRLAARAPDTEKNLAGLQERYKQTVAQLVPGDTPTLGAAALQDRISSLASEKNVSVQTTQVMKEESIGSFRRVTLRVTANAELRQLADFLTSLEFGQLRVTIPFIELSRRGAVVRQANTPHTVSATLEVAGIVQGSALKAAEGGAPAAGAGPVAPPPAAEGAGPGLAPQFPAAPPAAPNEAAAPIGALQIPDDPLGTAQMAGPSK
jgi:type II secretion system (T2SS) protein M